MTDDLAPPSALPLEPALDPALEPAPEPPPRPPTAADQLDRTDVASLLESADAETLTALTVDAVSAARADHTDAWLTRLDTLRASLLLRNERRLLALCLQGLVEVALGRARPDLAAPAARTLWGVRELLDQPWKAHQAMLLLARAQEAADDPAAAEATLTKALGAAQKLAPAGNVVPASAAAARTLTQLGQLLGRQGRGAEAAEWLSGAIDLAPDEETAQPAKAALAALQAR